MVNIAIDLIYEIFRIYARSSRLAIAEMQNYCIVYIMRLELCEYHYLQWHRPRNVIHIYTICAMPYTYHLYYAIQCTYTNVLCTTIPTPICMGMRVHTHSLLQPSLLPCGWILHSHSKGLDDGGAPWNEAAVHHDVLC